METCSVCGARLQELPVCRRCGTDWSPVMEVAAVARGHLRSAREAYERGDAGGMLFHARRALSKQRSAAANRLLATAALLSGDFHLALSAWRRDQQGRICDRQEANEKSA